MTDRVEDLGITQVVSPAEVAIVDEHQELASVVVDAVFPGFRLGTVALKLGPIVIFLIQL